MNTFNRETLLLYAVTDRTWLGGRTLAGDAEEALKGGVTMLQLREKDLEFNDFLAEAFEIKEICKKYGVPFIINDDVELALACGADGVHVGQSDMEAFKVRERLGPNKILGVSAQTAEQALLAEKSGADYIGAGAVFTTSTKKDADFVPYDELRAICSAVSIPVVAIGGIGAGNMEKLAGSGIEGVAVVSAIFAEKDIKAAAKELRALAEKTVERGNKK
ncbi:MAG: thiamine phosphate synthase [Oscillospiraceae bacterium]|nr:thiamine phosphate synthase [Oscillospiraceae bacterium]